MFKYCLFYRFVEEYDPEATLSAIVDEECDPEATLSSTEDDMLDKTLNITTGEDMDVSSLEVITTSLRKLNHFKKEIKGWQKKCRMHLMSWLV